MNINTNINLNNVNAAAMAGVEAPVAMPEQSGVLGGESLTVTQSVTAETPVRTVVPVLDEAEATDETITNDIIAKISQAADEAKAALEAASEARREAAITGASDTGLVDIYQVMNLLLQIARKQREVARTQRSADLANTVSAIKAQAAEMRSAAFLSMGISLALSVGATIFQGVSIYKTATAQHNINQTKIDSGLSQATQVTKLSAEARTPAAAVNQTETLGAKLTNAQREQVAARLDEIGNLQQNIESEQANIGVKQTELTATKEQLAALKSEYANNQHALAQAEVQNGGVDQNALPEIDPHRHVRSQDPLAGRNGNENFQAGVDKVELRMKQQTLKADISVLEAKIDKLETSIAAAETRLQTGKNDLLAKLEEHYTSVTGDGTRKLDAAQQYEIAKNFELRQANGFGTSVSEIRQTVAQKQQVLSNDLELSDDYMQAVKTKDTWTQLSGICGTLAQMLNGMGNTASTVVQSQATEKEALAKTEEYQKQESEELASNAKDLLTQVVQMLQQVNQMQNQSIERAIGA